MFLDILPGAEVLVSIDRLLWQSYRKQLTGALGVSSSSYKDAPWFTLADWAALNITGLIVQTSAAAALENKYFWGDRMPLWSVSGYQRGASLHDMYAAFLCSLDPGDALVEAALAKVNEFCMTTAERGAQSYPGYGISPELGSWYLAALQTLASSASPVLDITVDLSSGDGASPSSSLLDSSSAEGGSTSVESRPVLEDTPFLSHVAPTSSVSSLGATTTSEPKAPTALGATGAVQQGTLHFTAQCAQTFEVMPGGWYDTAMLPLYSSRIRPGSALAGRDLFGVNGVLNLRTAQIVVLLGRSLTIRSSPSTLSEVRAAAAQGGVLSAGGFAFQLGGQSTSVEAAGTGETMTLKDNISAPYVVGVVVENLEQTGE